MYAIDLFSGCGGLSLGLSHAGFQIVSAVEKDRHAFDTYTTNHKSITDNCFNSDIRTIKPFNVLEKIGIYQSELALVAGGPPCQGFSMANGQTRNPDNPKNEYVYDFINWIKALKPKAFLMENVKGFEQIDNGRFINDLLNALKNDLGYKNAVKIILDAADYGVPQHRKRVFLVGLRNGDFVESGLSDNNKTKFITVRDAIIGDLPKIDTLPGENLDNYLSEPTTKYQKKIRGNKKRLYNHITTKCADKILEKFSWIRQGENWTAIKDRIGIRVQYSSLYKRLDENQPSITMSNYRKSMIIHPRENRLLSVREAARLQSFPDNYVFKGGISSMQQQVGDAVPPLLAKEVGKELLKLL